MKQSDNLQESFMEDRTSGDFELLYKDWNKLFSDLLDTGMNSNVISYGQTPFIAFIRGNLPSWVRHDEELSKQRDWNSAVRLWIRDFEGAGIDLEDFGRREKKGLEY